MSGVRDRYYDPKIGRYLTSDPIGLRGGINTFNYVEANPLIYSDSFGLHKLDNFFGFGKDFWRWFHKQPDMKDLKDPRTGQVPYDDAKPAFDDWIDQGKPKADNKRNNRKNEGFGDPTLLLIDLLLPLALQPSDIACSERDCDGDGNDDHTGQPIHFIDPCKK